MRDVNPLEVGPKVYEIGNESASLQPPANSMSLLTSSHVEAASTLAVIASSNEPLLFLAGDLRIIAASASFCRTFGVDPASGPSPFSTWRRRMGHANADLTAEGYRFGKR